MIFRKLFGSQTVESDNITVLNSEEFKSAISKSKVQLVDVRTAREYNSGHIQKAVNIDFFNRSAFIEAFEKLNKQQPIYIYCQSGVRSRKASKRLAQMGFESIYDLKGGYMSWR
jgi:rhodanese-related sulfurtransferase